MFEKTDIICIGESLIELSSPESISSSRNFERYFGGDTVTTAVAASKLGAKTGFITVIGNDYWKDFLIDSLVSAEIDISQIRLSEEQNGVYFISANNDKKELLYYKKKCAASALNEDSVSEDYIKNAEVVYSTGTIQALSFSASEAVKKAFKIAKENGIKVAYDFNYSSAIWEQENAKEAFDEVSKYIDIMFVNMSHDIKPLFNVTSADLVIKTLWDAGIGIVIAREQNGNVSLGYNGEIITKSIFNPEDIVEINGAGDVFNGAFLYGISKGYTPYESLKLAAITASYQVQQKGSIKAIPSKNMILERYNSVDLS